MTRLIRFDPFKHWLAWPKWMNEWEEPRDRGLKIQETEKDIVAEAVVAGVPADNVDVHIEDGVLTIKAEKEEEENLPAGRQGKRTKGYRFSSYQYYYTAALSGGEWDKAKADVEDGVVRVTIPKAEAAKPRKIKVTAKKSK